MTTSERLYRALLAIYPRSFLRHYRQPMEQAFRDQLRQANGARGHASQGLVRLWLHTMYDVCRSALTEHLREGRLVINIAGGLAYLFAAAAIMLLARFEPHTDDSGLVVAFLFGSTFLLGCLNPRRVWLWSALGGCIPIADKLWTDPRFPAHGPGGALLVGCFVLAVGAAGSWSAFLLRKAMRTLA
ncbi:MAG TPA: hypothetical protein VGD59_15065 [Acidisarcina sp.]